MDLRNFNRNIRGIIQYKNNKGKSSKHFYPHAGVVGKVSKFDELYPNKTCYILKVHSGCMGDSYDVYLSPQEPQVTVDWVFEAGFWSSLWFVLRNFRKVK